MRSPSFKTRLWLEPGDPVEAPGPFEHPGDRRAPQRQVDDVLHVAHVDPVAGDATNSRLQDVVAWSTTLIMMALTIGLVGSALRG